MTAAEAYHGFWAGFGIPVFEENAVPDGAGVPCLTYRYGEGRGPAALSVSWWGRSASWLEAREFAERVSARLPEGGVTIPFGGGLLWILRGEPFAVSMGDEGDPYMKRVLFNVTARVYGGGAG